MFFPLVLIPCRHRSRFPPAACRFASLEPVKGSIVPCQDCDVENNVCFRPSSQAFVSVIFTGVLRSISRCCQYRGAGKFRQRLHLLLLGRPCGRTQRITISKQCPGPREQAVTRRSHYTIVAYRNQISPIRLAAGVWRLRDREPARLQLGTAMWAKVDDNAATASSPWNGDNPNALPGPPFIPDIIIAGCHMSFKNLTARPESPRNISGVLFAARAIRMLLDLLIAHSAR